MPLQKQYAVDFLVETLMAHEPGTITLCTLGPLTNIALALIREPTIASRIQQIVAMGGGFFEGGNTTPAAEFNIYVDPQAARVVFHSGMPITLIPLDCTHKALTSRVRVAKFRQMTNRAGPVVAELLDFFERFDEQKYGTDGGPLHDPCVIAWLLEARTLLRPRRACGNRMRIRTHHGHDGRRLVGRDRQAAHRSRHQGR